MNLEEEMWQKGFGFCHSMECCSCAPIEEEDGMRLISVDDAIKIAKEYAKEMCREQRRICSMWVEDSSILEAPLATEEK